MPVSFSSPDLLKMPSALSTKPEVKTAVGKDEATFGTKVPGCAQRVGEEQRRVSDDRYGEVRKREESAIAPTNKQAPSSQFEPCPSLPAVRTNSGSPQCCFHRYVSASDCGRTQFADSHSYVSASYRSRTHFSDTSGHVWASNRIRNNFARQFRAQNQPSPSPDALA